MNLSAEHRERLSLYAERLLEANRKINLTGAKTPAAIWAHIEDSLELLPFVQSPLVDIGSGGGFPAIPLAIVAGVELTCIEAVAKKARFLEAILGELRLAGSVITERAEVAAHDPTLRARFASATARAVSSPSAVAELTIPYLRAGGAAVLQRGHDPPEERQALEDGALMLGGSVELEMALPAGRWIVIVRKTGETPARFPRRSGIPSKRPLGARFHGEHDGETAKSQRG